jgi:hypothetical protein
MKTIWKFPLETESIMMPAGAEILTCQMQRGCPCLWALVEPYAPPAPRRFHVIGTGWEIPPETLEGSRYVSTFQQPDGLVFHVFEAQGAE